MKAFCRVFLSGLTLPLRLICALLSCSGAWSTLSRGGKPTPLWLSRVAGQYNAGETMAGCFEKREAINIWACFLTDLLATADTAVHKQLKGQDCFFLLSSFVSLSLTSSDFITGLISLAARSTMRLTAPLQTTRHATGTHSLRDA